jgi:hypothetical protein
MNLRHSCIPVNSKLANEVSPISKIMPDVICCLKTRCWLYMGGHNQTGYGVLRVGRWGKIYAHSVVFKHFRDSISDGYQLDHLCRVKCCCSPYHLESVSPRENAICRSMAKDERSIIPDGSVYRVQYRKGGNYRYLGNFSDIDDALWTYREAERNLFRYPLVTNWNIAN